MRMKNNYFLMLFVLFTLKSFSQDPVLFDHTWYLEKVVIDNEEIFAVSNTEVNHVELFFDSPEGYDFHTSVCNDFIGDLEYSGVESFTFEFYYQTLIECDLYDSAVFEMTYFNFFSSTADKDFIYDISTVGNDYFLMITNDDGNQAFYGNQPTMSSETFMEWNFSLFPNPVQNTLNIHLNTTEKGHIILYTMNGTLLHNQVLESFDTAIDVKGLSKGAYFLVIEGENGTKQVKKFLKK